VDYLAVAHMIILNSLLKHLYAANFHKWDSISWPLVCFGLLWDCNYYVQGTFW